MPYVAYADDYNNGATVMMFDGNTWIPVGDKGLPSTSFQSSYTSLAIDENDVPYLALRDGGHAQKLTVMKYNGEEWENVGDA